MDKYNICTKHAGVTKSLTEMINPLKSKACIMLISQFILTITNIVFIQKKGKNLRHNT